MEHQSRKFVDWPDAVRRERVRLPVDRTCLVRQCLRDERNPGSTVHRPGMAGYLRRIGFKVPASKVQPPQCWRDSEIANVKKCDGCHEVAVFHITEIIEGAVKELHLCENHFRDYMKNPQLFLSGG